MRVCRSEMADARRSATGSFGGEPARVLVTASRQNWRRMSPMVYEDVVSGMRERETLRARRAR